MNPQEQSLIERITQGDENAMAEYLQYRRVDLLAVILSKMGPALRSKIEVDDIFQEVATQACKHMQELDFTAQSPFGWLCELAQRRIVDADRRFSAQKRARHHEVAIHGSGDQSQIGFANLLVASITSPSHAFSRKQKEFRLLEALAQLSEEQQASIKMRYAEGLSNKEIAQRIGKSDGATRVLLTRALQKLKTIVESDPSADRKEPG